MPLDTAPAGLAPVIASISVAVVTSILKRVGLGNIDTRIRGVLITVVVLLLTLAGKFLGLVRMESLGDVLMTALASIGSYEVTKNVTTAVKK